MKINVTDNEKTFNKLFKFIMHDKKYSTRGYRKYRILFFGFLFGAVCTDNLFQIFYEDIITDYEQERQSYANTLNYLLKQKYLLKGKDSYYFVAKPGVDILFNYLCKLQAIDKDFFYALHRQVRLHASHAANTGLTLLSLSNSDYSVFYISKALESSGIISKLSSKNSIYPDAIAINESRNQILCIEADSSTEHRNSGLYAKLSNYVNLISSSDDSNVSILFSIWSKYQDINHDIKLKLSLHILFDMFKLFKSCSNTNISFNDFFEFYSKSAKELPYIFHLISIQKIYIPNIDFSKEFNRITDFILFINSFSKSYYSRKNYMKVLSENSSDIYNKFISGLSVITSPINAINYILNFVNLSSVFIDNFIYKYHNNLACFNREFHHKFKPNTNDDSPIFHNSYILKNGIEFYQLAFENVSEDLGGYIRCKKYLSHYSENSSSQLILVCIFNDLEVPDFMNDFFFHYPNSKSVHFISYSEVFDLSFSRDEN